MDFFSIIAVLLRRWYVTIPVFLIGMGLVLRAALGVGAEYRSTASVIFIPASVRIDFDGDDLFVEETNPYLFAGSTRTLARSVPITVGSSDFRRDAFDQGLSPNYELELDEAEPIVHILVKGETPEQSSDTLDWVIVQLERVLLDRQGVEPGLTVEETEREFARTETLSTIKAIADDSASVKVMGFLGVSVVLVTVMAAFAVEGWAERREEKRDGERSVGARA